MTPEHESPEFYDRPMVRRLQEIFGFPVAPGKVTEQQFDCLQRELEALARLQWHQIGARELSIYLMDLCYATLQQELFDYLFPAALILWWEGQLSRKGGPEGECDFYHAVDHGAALYKMMNVECRQHVYHWMIDAYMDGVDAWAGELRTTHLGPDAPNDLHGPLWSFNSLGKSVPILEDILERLMDVSTLGRAQWWLVFASGLIWRENECPAVPPWTPDGGGGGIYLLEEDSAIYDHGYLSENHRAFKDQITYANVLAMLLHANEILLETEYAEWAAMAFDKFENDADAIKSRIDALVSAHMQLKLEREWDR
ncbi:MAG TPA: hypothetical protein VFG65_01545 [Fimbriimonadales bacterium]|jgi:hypothetical protein|nr:hypothetical protein [Fimbriimonadales bacterium]